MKQVYVIYSANESAISDGAGFWSNDLGWTVIESADTFSSKEAVKFNLPLSTGADATWVLFSDVTKHYGASQSSEEAMVPPGWKLVPEEPTTAMVLAAYSAQGEATSSGCETIYRAMLEVAPKPSLNQPSTMEVSLDGGVTYHPVTQGVRIVYKDVPVDGEDGLGQVHVNATTEGLITDVWVSREEHLDHNIGTKATPLEDIVSRLVAENE